MRGLLFKYLIVTACAAAVLSAVQVIWALWPKIVSLQPAVQAAIFGALIALTGVLLNTSVAGWNMGRQLAHDREQKERDRRLALRREIYQGMAAYLQDGLFAISDFAQLHLPRPQTQAKWRENAHFAAKLHLMAEGELLAAFTEANQQITAAVLTIVDERLPAEQMQAQLGRMLETIKAHENARDKALDTLKQKGRDGNLDPATTDRLTKISTFEHGNRDAVAKQHDELLNQIQVHQRRLNLMALEAQMQTYPALMQVAKQARLELGEAYDSAAYKELLRTMTAHMQQLIDRIAIPDAAPTAITSNSEPDAITNDAADRDVTVA